VHARLAKPLGVLLVRSDGAALTHVQFEDPARPAQVPDSRRDELAAPLVEPKRQLAAYFAGELRAFALPLAPRGSEFQRKVWAALAEIPFGAATTYGALARRLGAPRARARAP
jgi:methylated-DNA-[protein]-cysteine S-methyltransferase